ncbi:hypothetical protein C8R46DRAFT_1234684 [Mycena filopes]|nr:hypothetical protein C8R46DRAFT_1234684 [Mycena filopes]
MSQPECEDCGLHFPLQQGDGRCRKCDKLKGHNIQSDEYRMRKRALPALAAPSPPHTPARGSGSGADPYLLSSSPVIADEAEDDPALEWTNKRIIDIEAGLAILKTQASHPREAKIFLNSMKANNIGGDLVAMATDVRRFVPLPLPSDSKLASRRRTDRRSSLSCVISPARMTALSRTRAYNALHTHAQAWAEDRAFEEHDDEEEGTGADTGEFSSSTLLPWTSCGRIRRWACGAHPCLVLLAALLVDATCASFQWKVVSTTSLIVSTLSRAHIHILLFIPPPSSPSSDTSIRPSPAPPSSTSSSVGTCGCGAACARVVFRLRISFPAQRVVRDCSLRRPATNRLRMQQRSGPSSLACNTHPLLLSLSCPHPRRLSRSLPLPHSYTLIATPY